MGSVLNEDRVQLWKIVSSEVGGGNGRTGLRMCFHDTELCTQMWARWRKWAFILFVFICMSVFVCPCECDGVGTHKQRSEDNLQESVFSVTM